MYNFVQCNNVLQFFYEVFTLISISPRNTVKLISGFENKTCKNEQEKKGKMTFS